MYNLEEVGKRVQTLRKSKGITQEEFANKVAIHCDTVRKIEQGKRGMSIDMAMIIAEELKVSLDYLLNGKVTYGSSKELLKMIQKMIEGYIDSCDE